MKRALILCAILIAVSFSWAYVTNIGYYDATGAHTIYFTQVPSATITEIGVCYTAASPITLLQAANFYCYAIVGAPTALVVKVYTASATGFPTGTALGSVTVPRASVTTASWNTVNLSSMGLAFNTGDRYVITLSVTGGVPTTTGFQFYLNRIAAAEFPSHSVRYLSGAWAAYQGVTIGGVANSGGEYFISSTVNYDVPFHDVQAKSLYFNGDMFLSEGTSVTYSADIKNTGDQSEDHIPVTLQISDATYPARTVLYTNTQYIPAMAPGDTVYVATFPEYTYDSTGEYVVKITTGLATDMDATNNEIQLEQQVVALPATLTYDDGTAETAWAPNTIQSEFANEFDCPIGPFRINQLSYYVYGATWPTPGSTVMGIAVYDDLNGAPGTRIYYQEVTCVRGAWNTYDVSAANLIFPSGKFYVTFVNLAAYPNCPGLAVDHAQPYSAWKASWEKVGATGAWENVYPEFGMDWMIRASVDYIEFWSPKNLAVSNLGNDINLAWDIVPAATTYNVYKGTTPTTITTPLATGVVGHGYTDVNAAVDSKAFYVVRAAAAARSANSRRSIPVSNSQNKTFIGNAVNTPAVLRAEN